MSVIAVLGATGFIGSQAAERLRKDGQTVEVFGSDHADLMDPLKAAQLARRWTRATTVIVCAGVARDKDASWHAARTNILIARNIAQAIPEGGWRGLLYLSSSAVYGSLAASGLITETTDLDPADPYSFSKVESENALAERAWPRNMPFLALRPSIVFGEGDNGRSLIGRWTADALAGRPIAVKGRGKARIDLLEVQSLCDVIVAWARHPFGGAVNVGSGHALPVNEIIEAIGEGLGTQPAVDPVSRAAEPEQDLRFDLTRLHALVPSYAPVNPRAGIRSYAQRTAAVERT